MTVSKRPLILIVEDDEQMRMMLRRMMERAGYDVIEARNGNEGVQLYKLAEPDAVLLDVMMPGMNGIEAATEMRTIEARGWVPILMLTARDKVEDRVRGLEAGADDFLTKPFNGSELIARMRALLRLRQAHSRLRNDFRNLERSRHELQQQVDSLRRLLGRTFAPETAESLIQNQGRLFATTHEVTVCVLNATLTGLAPYLERRGGTDSLHASNRIWNELLPLLFEHRGTFDKFTGEGLLAFFGAPLGGENDAAQAVGCALAMQQRFAQLEQRDGHIKGLGLGIALVTGAAVAGNAGSDEVLDYTVVGPAPSGAKFLGGFAASGQILACARTQEAVAPYVSAHPLSPLELPGAAEPVGIFAISGQHRPTR